MNDLRSELEAVLVSRMPYIDMDVEPNQEMPPGLTVEEALDKLVRIVESRERELAEEIVNEADKWSGTPVRNFANSIESIIAKRWDKEVE